MLDGDEWNLVVSSIYDAGLDDEGWPAALTLVTEAFGAAFGALLLRSSDLHKVEARVARVDPAGYQQFLRRHFRTSPFHRRMPAWQTGAVIRSAEHMPFDALRRTAMYQDYWRPHRLHDGLRLNIAALPGGHIHYLNLIRPRGAPDFGVEELGLARSLMPHLQRAAAIRRRLGLLSLRAQNALAVLDTLPQAMLLLRGDGRLLHTNQRADVLLRSATVLTARAGLIGAASLENEDRLLTAVGRAARDRIAGAVRFPRPDASPLLALTMPLGAARAFWLPEGAAVLLCVADPDDLPGADGPALAELFGLTPGEARLALALIGGAELDAIAARTGRSRNTLRTHLARLRAKTGTNRQGALIRILGSVPGLRQVGGIENST